MAKQEDANGVNCLEIVGGVSLPGGIVVGGLAHDEISDIKSGKNLNPKFNFLNEHIALGLMLAAFDWAKAFVAFNLIPYVDRVNLPPDAANMVATGLFAVGIGLMVDTPAAMIIADIAVAKKVNQYNRRI